VKNPLKPEPTTTLYCMKTEGIFAKGFLIALAILLIPVPAMGAQNVTAGTTCKVLKQQTIYQNKVFTCIKSGKKLVWNKGTIITKPAVTPSPKPDLAYAPSSQPSSNIELCKTKEVSTSRSMYENALPTGFPTSKFNFATKSGTVKWALVPLDFTDIPGEADFRSRVDKQMVMLTEWFDVVSEGKFKVEWVVADKWTTLPGTSTDYQIPFSDGPDRSPAIAEFWNKAIAASDKNFDYTNIQTVNFILPLKQKVVDESLQGFPWEQAVKNYMTQEGRISSFSIPGVFFNSSNRQYWSYWAHEFGHAMGIPHVGSSRYANPFLGLDLMGNQDGYTRELTGWLRFVAGWLDDQKVYCQELKNLSSNEITLAPLSSISDGIKMVVIPITNSKTLIIESRRETKFSCVMPTKRNGVLAYIYDATLGHGEEFLIPITPKGRPEEGSSNCAVSWYPNPLLYKGEKIDVEGVTIEVLDSLNYDKIRISKKN
jgi:M6 family metalloprotease-like protein